MATQAPARLDPPPGWSIREYKRSPELADVLQAANFALPSEDNDIGQAAMAAMPGGGIFISLIDLGETGPWMHPELWQEASLPLSVSTTDLNWLHGTPPSTAARYTIVNGRAILLIVSFGSSARSDESYRAANEVLARIEL